MKKNLFEIVIVLDESGSMASRKYKTISAFNEFLDSQKRIKGKADFTLIKFSDYYKTVNDAVPLKQADYLSTDNYVPSFTTALLDAVGKTINHIKQRHANISKKSRPEKVIFAIITDGYENSSQEFTRKQIFNMVSHQKKKHSWEFVFMGADIDAWGHEIGIHDNISFAKREMQRSLKGLSYYTGNIRKRGIKRSADEYFNLSEDELDKRLKDLEE